MFILLAAYAVMTLLAAIHMPGQMAAKWGRVYVTLLMIAVAIFFKREYKLGPAVIGFICFAGLYMLAGLYSNQPITAIKYKGLYLVLVIAGGFVAQSVRSERDLRIGLRCLVCAGALVGSAMLFDLVKNPAAMGRIGRFEPWEIVATIVGAICGPLGIICAFSALYDRSKIWKIISYASGGSLALCIVYSGSRGGLFMAGIGCMIVGMPVIKRPVLAISAFTLVSVVAYIILSLAGNTDSAERLTEVNFDSRAEKWALAGSMFREKMMFGAGWVAEDAKVEGGSTANMHNMYLQIAVEMGVLGLIVFCSAMSVVGFHILSMFRRARVAKSHIEIAYLAVGLMAAILAFGMVESGPLMGSTAAGILLAFSIGLIDRNAELIKIEGAWINDQDDWRDEGEGDQDGPDDNGDWLDSWDGEAGDVDSSGNGHAMHRQTSHDSREDHADGY